LAHKEVDMDFEVKTGYGYFKDKDGNIITKAELPKGKHLLKEGYTYYEVSSKEELDQIEVYQPPETEEEKQIRLLRQSAIAKLKSLGLTDEEIKTIV